MIDHSVAASALWQTGTAVVQAFCSIVLLGWYVLAAHLDRARTRRERADDFTSLVRLCHDLGTEAKARTHLHLQALARPAPESPDPSARPAGRFGLWRADMAVIYVCLNEVPHYEVRNPAFSTALTRLWLEVDTRGIAPDGVEDRDCLIALLTAKYERICREVDAMGSLIADDADHPRAQRRLGGGVKRRGYAYTAEGFAERVLN